MAYDDIDEEIANHANLASSTSAPTTTHRQRADPRQIVQKFLSMSAEEVNAHVASLSMPYANPEQRAAAFSNNLSNVRHRINANANDNGHRRGQPHRAPVGP
jgi:DNA-binding IclR family transcriptional regulator